MFAIADKVEKSRIVKPRRNRISHSGGSMNTSKLLAVATFVVLICIITLVTVQANRAYPPQPVEPISSAAIFEKGQALSVPVARRFRASLDCLQCAGNQRKLGEV